MGNGGGCLEKFQSSICAGVEFSITPNCKHWQIQGTVDPTMKSAHLRRGDNDSQ
jgi:hypothetical protein